MSLSVGGKEWWLDYLAKTDYQSGLSEKEGETRRAIELNERFEFIDATRYQSLGYRRDPRTPEKELKDELVHRGLFREILGFEQEVGLGSNKTKIDVLASTGNGVLWVVECKITHTEAQTLNIRAIGQAIGQVQILAYCYKNHFKSNLRSKILPAICTWTLGSGSAVVRDICRMAGVTCVELLDPIMYDIKMEKPLPWPLLSTRINYLRDGDPKPYCEDWR